MTTRRTLLATAALSPMFATPFGTARPAFAQEATPSTIQGAFDVETGVLYGEPGEDARELDVYRPVAGETPRPTVIIIHGGAWTEGFADRTYMAEIAANLAEAGYVAFNIAYRLLNGEPGHNVWPAQLDDVQRAVRWVRANAETYGVDPDRVAALGHSAGGHLANMLGVRETNDWSDPTAELFSSRVNCVIDLAGDVDLSLPYPNTIDNQSVRNLLGGTVEEVPDHYRDASPITWVSAKSAPFLVIHGASDDANPVLHAQMLVEALHRSSVDFVHVELAEGDHISAVIWENCGPWMLTFLAVQFGAVQ